MRKRSTPVTKGIREIRKRISMKSFKTFISNMLPSLKAGKFPHTVGMRTHLHTTTLNRSPNPKAWELQLSVFREGYFCKHPDQQLCMAKHQRNVWLSFYSCHYDLWRRPSPSGDQSSVCYQTPCSHRRRQWERLENHQFSYVLPRCIHLWVFLLLGFIVFPPSGLRIGDSKS